MNYTARLKYSELYVNKGILLVGSSPPSKLRNLDFKMCSAICNSFVFHFLSLNSVAVLQLIKRQWHLNLRHFCENVSLLADEVLDRIMDGCRPLQNIHWLYPVKTGTKLQIPQNVVNFLTNREALSVSIILCSMQLVTQSVVTKSVIKKKQRYKANFLSVRFGQLQR
jgi:hypothetical protein